MLKILKADDSGDERLVYGEVYAPLRPDVQGEFMDADAIKSMAHDFLQRQMNKAIDVQHDNRVVPGLTIVESFIARKGDPDFIEGSWVVCCHVNDDSTWQKVKKGELNGFSVEALVVKENHDVEVDIPDQITGRTTKSDDHEHDFTVKFDDKGQMTGGSTTLVKGHTHQITTGTITDESQGHRHRFSSVDNVKIVGTKQRKS
jgi:hypothetical protein